MMLARAMAASGVAVMRLPTRASRVVTRCARGPAAAAAPTARPAVPTFPGTAAAAGASCEMRARRGHLVIAAAKLPPKKQYSTRRMRASDEFVAEEEDEDYDEYVHHGRPNRSALKRLMTEYRNLTKELCSLPKSSIAKIEMPDDIRDEVYATIKITSNIARKRAEGRVTKLIRGLADEEALPIQTAVENLKNGVGLLTVDPEVEALAMGWREALMGGDNDVQSEVFGHMQARDDWTFTRQELGQLVTGARKEKAEAEAARAEEAAAKEAAEKEAIVMPDGTTVPSSVGAPTGKRKKSGAGKSTKQLLKNLRKIAGVARADGLA
jgi:ribosomal 50S subunit-associated protein YjgA (DUF615 family)